MSRRGFYLLENEVVCIAWWGCEHDYHGHEPVLEQTSQRRIERPVAGPETREGKDAFTAELLDKTALGEDDAENISKGRERDEDGECALGLGAKHVTEQRGGDEAFRGDDFLGRHRGEISNVDEHVQDRDGSEGQRGRNLQRPNRILGLGERVVGVAVSDVAPDDIVQRSDNPVCASRGSLECMVEIVRLVDLDGSSQGSPSRDHNQENDGKLDHTQEILQPQTPLQEQAVYEEGSGDASKSDTTLVPSVDFDVGSVQYVLSKDDRVRSGPAKQDDVAGVQSGSQEPGFAVDELQIVLLSTVPWYGGSKFEIDGHSCRRDHHAKHPDEEGQSNTSG